MKKLIKHPSAKYLAVMLCAFLFVPLYGFTIGGQLSAWHGAVLFVAYTCIFSVCYSRQTFTRLLTRLGKTVAVALIAMVLSVVLYGTINCMSGDFMMEYDAVVTHADYWRGRTLYFDNPNGENRYVNLYDYDPFKEDDDDYLFGIGDTVRVREYRGLFDAPFCLLTEKEGT